MDDAPDFGGLLPIDSPEGGFSILLSAPNVGARERAYVEDCLANGWVSSHGPYVGRLEEAMRELTGAAYAVGCVNGTAGLHVALLLAGVRPGDEVIVPTVTFISTVNAVNYVGAQPVFMDCDEYLNMDAEKLAAFLEEECGGGEDGLIDLATGRPVRAVMPVHVFGNPCDMEAILAAARPRGLAVVEDAAESLGSRFTGGSLAGRHTGALGEVGVFSFNGNKIATCGAGGMIVTDDPDLAEGAAYLTTQAKDDAIRGVHGAVGYNYRLSNLHAAVGLAQVERLDEFLEVKRRNFELYREGVSEIEGLDLLGVPEGTRANHWFCSLIVEPELFGTDKEGVIRGLAARGIESRPLWCLNHWQAPYRDFRAYRIERAPWFWERVVNLPCSTDLAPEDIHEVLEALRSLGRR